MLYHTTCMKTKRNQAVKTLRDLLGWSQAEFAEVIGMSKHTVVSWECGRNRLEPAAASRINAVTGANINDLVRGGAAVRFYDGKQYSKGCLEHWRKLFCSHEVAAARMADYGAFDLRFVLLAAALPGSGKAKDRLPAVWESFMDWARQTSKEFNLGHQIVQLRKQKRIPAQITETYGAWRSFPKQVQESWEFKDDAQKRDSEKLTLSKFRLPFYVNWDIGDLVEAVKLPSWPKPVASAQPSRPAQRRRA